ADLDDARGSDQVGRAVLFGFRDTQGRPVRTASEVIKVENNVTLDQITVLQFHYVFRAETKASAFVECGFGNYVSNGGFILVLAREGHDQQADQAECAFFHTIRGLRGLRASFT